MLPHPISNPIDRSPIGSHCPLGAPWALTIKKNNCTAMHGQAEPTTSPNTQLFLQADRIFFRMKSHIAWGCCVKTLLRYIALADHLTADSKVKKRRQKKTSKNLFKTFAWLNNFNLFYSKTAFFSLVYRSISHNTGEKDPNRENK